VIEVTKFITQGVINVPMNRQSNSVSAQPPPVIGGFTLIELLVVLVVASIVAMIGIPAYRNIVADSRITSTANELISSLILARSEAIKRAAFVTVCRSADGQTCGGDNVSWEQGWIVFSNVSGATASTVDQGDEIIRTFPATPGALTISPVAPVSGFITFRPAGTAGTTAQNITGTLTLCDFRGAASARAVIIMSSGRVRISRDTAHDGNPLACP